MKIIVLLCVVLMPFSICAENYSPYSVNLVGFNKVQTKAGGFTIISAPWNTRTRTLDDLLGPDGTAGPTAEVADNVILFNKETQALEIFWLCSDDNNTRPRWKGNNGWATNVYIDPGTAFWFRNRGPEDRTLMTLGDVVMAGAVTNTIIPDMQLVNYPFSVDRPLNEMQLTHGLAGPTAEVADNIILFDTDTEEYALFWLAPHPNNGASWRNTNGWADSKVLIKCGEGFWYRNRSDHNLIWVETNPCPELLDLRSR